MKGVKNATDSELEGTVGRCEFIGQIGAIGVFVGVAAEVVFAYRHAPFNSVEGRWGPVIADALVAIGVAVEVICSALAVAAQRELGRRSNDKLGAAEQAAAEANRAAEEERTARVALEAQLQPRMVTQEQARAIEALRGKIKTVLIAFETDAETSWYAATIAQAFIQAGVATIQWPRAANIHSFGSLIYDPRMKAAQLSEDAKALHEIFEREIGMPLKTVSRLPEDVQLSPAIAADTPGLILGGKFPVEPYAGTRKIAETTASDS